MSSELLWAPWRLAYIKGSEPAAAMPANLAWLPDADRDCFFCRGLADSRDRENLLVLRGPHAATFLNRYPYNNGHLLVAPKRHAGRLESLTADEQLEIQQS